MDRNIWSISIKERTLHPNGKTYRIVECYLIVLADGWQDEVVQELLHKSKNAKADDYQIEDYSDEVAIFLKGRHIMNFQYEGDIHLA